METPGINAIRSGGQPLPSSVRSFFEPRFGHDFSRVRIHTDEKAAESARAIGALAYTVGRDIVFDAGQYAPATRGGQQLLAHELAHVVQDPGGNIVCRQVLGVDPISCRNAGAAIMAWGLPQALEWIIRTFSDNRGRPPTVGTTRVWKLFTEWKEVDIDFHFTRPGRTVEQHVKWRVRPVQRDGKWILQSTITDWWDGHPIVFYLPDGVALRSGEDCTIYNAPRPQRRPAPRGRPDREVPV